MKTADRILSQIEAFISEGNYKKIETDKVEL